MTRLDEQFTITGCGHVVHRKAVMRLLAVVIVGMLGAGAFVGSTARPALAADTPLLAPADLLQKVWQQGTVRVIVRLCTPFAAEGHLRDEVAATLQRAPNLRTSSCLLPCGTSG